MPWHEIGAALKKSHYQGAVVMEPFISPGGQVGEDIRVWRDLSGGADEAEIDAKAGRSMPVYKSSLGKRGITGDMKIRKGSKGERSGEIQSRADDDVGWAAISARAAV